MRHSGWFPDYVLRLFRREKARFSDDLVHERVICEGPIGRLSGVLDHHPVLRLEDALRRVDTYSAAGAGMVGAPGRGSCSPGATRSWRGGFSATSTRPGGAARRGRSLV